MRGHHCRIQLEEVKALWRRVTQKIAETGDIHCACSVKIKETRKLVINRISDLYASFFYLMTQIRDQDFALNGSTFNRINKLVDFIVCFHLLIDCDPEFL